MKPPRVDPLPRSGDTFVLRRLSTDDLAAFQAYRHDPEVGRYQGWSPVSDAEALAFLAEMHAAPVPRPGGWTQIGIAEPGSGRLIGDVGVFLERDRRYAEIGVTLGRPSQGRGVATAVLREVISLIFECSPVERVIGITDARNVSSVRLLERAGMRRIETQTALFRGEPCVEYVYATTRDERRPGPCGNPAAQVE